MTSLICEHWGAVVGLSIGVIWFLYWVWKVYIEDKIYSMFDGEPWNEDEYQEWIKKQKEE